MSGTELQCPLPKRAQRHREASTPRSGGRPRGGHVAESQPGLGRPRRTVGFFGHIARATLIVGLAGATIAVAMTGRIGSATALTMPAMAMGAPPDRQSWAAGQVLPRASMLEGSLTAASRARVRAPVSMVGCASSAGADGTRSVNITSDTIYWPLTEGSFTITSPFMMRVSPVSGQLLQHEGIDMAAPLDTPVVAVYQGTVTEVAENSRSGAYVQIRHQRKDGTVFYSAYLHQYMNRITVKVGDQVTAGQTIGAVGNNGWSTGPHLHFEIHNEKDEPVDPEAWMAGVRAIYPGQEACQ